MNILVIGGSYFFGRWFVQFASKTHNITVMNRGSVPVGISGVTEIKADRHDKEAVSKIKNHKFDCIVDFCAYEEGDIRLITELLGRPGLRYLYISTVDVYKKGTGLVLTEDAPLSDQFPVGPEGDYIRGKVTLERELESVCSAAGMEYCALRPSVLYGPANYAPREGLYFRWIREAGQIYQPIDATGFFQPLYIKDAVLMTIKICEAEHIEASYNLCPPDVQTYTSFAAVLHRISDIAFEEIPVSTKTILEENLPLPFPLTLTESERYAADRIAELEIPITDFEEGMRTSLRLFG